MLEEALRDDKGRAANPSETALAMINFLQYDLMGGGASAEARFYNSLFGPLCERVFGPMDESYRHSTGTGWLAAQARWARPAAATPSLLPPGASRPPPPASASSAPVSARSSAPSSASWDTDPVVRLLATAGGGRGGDPRSSASSPSSSTAAEAQGQRSPPLGRGGGGGGGSSLPTLVEILSGESENRPAAGFSYPFGALPRAARDAWMAVLELSLLPPAPAQPMANGGGPGVGAGAGMPSAWGAPSGLWSEGGLPGAVGAGGGGGGAMGSKQQNQEHRREALLAAVTDNDVRLFGTLLFKSPPSREQQPGLVRWRQLSLAQKEAAAAASRAYQHQHRRAPPPDQQGSFRQGEGLPSRAGAGGALFRPSQNLAPSPFSPAAALMSPRAGAGTNPKQEEHQQQQRGEDDISIASVDVILSILEYYLLSFLRFPTALGSAAAARPSMAGASGSNVPFGEMVYNYLFGRYLSYFLPYAPAAGEDPDGRGGGGSRSRGRHICLGASNAGGRPGNAQSELFVRLLICLWLEAPVRAAPTGSAVEALVEQQQRHRAQTNPRGDAAGPDPRTFEYSLDRAYDLAQARTAVEASSSLQASTPPPPSHVRSCLRKLVAYLLSDPALRTGVQNFGRRDRSNGAAAAQQQLLLLPDHALWAVQPSLYNYVRLTLRTAPIHAADSAFFSSLDLWLLWLEPWNLTRTKMISSLKDSQSRFVLTVPRYSDASKYDPVWEPYVAANLHLYLTPLAIFLRRSRELDFSPRKFDSSMRTVRRVFRVYSPYLVQALNGGCARRYPALVQRHADLLGKFAPPMPLDLAASSLSYCQGDMQSLLEEVHMQHMKKVRELDFVDRIGAWIEGLFGMGIVQGEEKELADLVSRAMGIVGFPATYRVFPSGGAAGLGGARTATSGTRPATRAPDGQLTEQGRAQLASGEIKCRAGDVAYVGDPMYGLVRPHEVALLVEPLVRASDALNGKLGCDATTLLRINLRFLADYRNLVFTLLTLYLTYKFYF